MNQAFGIPMPSNARSLTANGIGSGLLTIEELIGPNESGWRNGGLTISTTFGRAARSLRASFADYGPDLAKIHDRQDAFRTAILTLNERPAMALTPQQIAEQIEIAGRKGRASDHHAWADAQRDLGQSIQSISSVVASAMTEQKQRQWLAGCAVAAMVIGFMLGATIPARIDQAVPEHWYWPEKTAASALQRNGWDAGMRLLQVSDPQRLHAMSEAMRLENDNADVLTECRAHLVKGMKTTGCTIRLRPPELG